MDINVSIKRTSKMSDGRKRILRQNLAVTDRESYYKEERLAEFLDSNGAFYNDNESNTDDESYHFANSCYKIVPPMFFFIILFI